MNAPTGSCGARSRKLGEVGDHVVRIVGQTLDIVFLENKSRLVVLGIKTDKVGVFLDFNFLCDLRDGERDR